MVLKTDYGASGASCQICYALVTYIADPLGEFLDDMRRTLVPGCAPHAHVTLLPPRPITGTPDEALEQIQERMIHVPAFELEAGDIAVFPVTNVIYVEIGLGRETLQQLHADLNRGAVGYKEPFSYHPHITLAQELAEDSVEETARTARRLWAGFPHSRRIAVQEVSFVQSAVKNCWTDLAAVRLQMQPARVRRSR